MSLCLYKKHLERVSPTINCKYLDHLDLIAHNPMTKSQMHVNHISLLRKYKNENIISILQAFHYTNAFRLYKGYHIN